MSLLNAQLLVVTATQQFDAMQLPPAADKARLSTFITDAGRAIGSAFGQWQQMASLANVTINGPVAMGGRIVGPSVEALIMAPLAATYPNLGKAVAAAVSEQFARFCQLVTVPGLPWYPMFGAYPGPIAPPTPNMPAPFTAIAAAGRAMMTSSQLSQAYAIRQPANAPAGATEAVDALMRSLDQQFSVWLTTTMVTNVLGSGPVPAFAPPNVPVGAVMGGVGNMMPGGFA